MKKKTFWTQIAYGGLNFFCTWVALAVAIVALYRWTQLEDWGDRGNAGMIGFGALAVLLANLLITYFNREARAQRESYALWKRTNLGA